MSNQHHRLASNTAAACAAVLFGASVVAVRIAVRDVPPITLALLRFGQGTVLLFVGLALFRRDLLRVAPRDLPFLGLLGVLFYTIFPITFNAGMQYVEASRGALLLATMPLWTLMLGRLLTHERLTARQTLGVMTSVAGVVIVIADRGAVAAAGSMKGNALLLTTAWCGALYNLLAKRMVVRYGGVTVTFYAMLFGTLLLIPAPFIEHARGLATMRGETLAMVIFLGAFGGALGFSLWTAALKHLSPTQVSVYINLNPLAATILGATLLHERLSAMFLLGFVAVATGVVIVNWTRGAVKD
ncbi:MAG: DMT family transporter [Gemmatimonadaceae bacterium]